MAARIVTKYRQDQIQGDSRYPYKLFVIFAKGSPAVRKEARKTLDTWYRASLRHPYASEKKRKGTA